MVKIYWLLALALGCVMFSACHRDTSAKTPAAPAAPAKVTGTVTYLQRSALPPDAKIQVSLQDVSLQDAPSVKLGEQVIEAQGKQVPFPFEITYNPSEIKPNHRYTVSARITTGDKLLFISDTSHPVLTNGAPSTAEIIVKPVC